MGLDITAYSHLESVGCCNLDLDSCDEALHTRAYVYSSFPQSMRGLIAYGSEDNFTLSGCFKKTAITEVYDFHAGSYSGYGQWRNRLQVEFNPYMTESGPFYELIWFSDCEGAIGPDAASDLFEDFLIHDHKAESLEQPYFYDQYKEWTLACSLARASGLIEFH
jgi:hypothetical protein